LARPGENAFSLLLTSGAGIGVCYFRAVDSPRTDFAKILADVSCGNKQAADFCWSYIAFCHFVDDVADGETKKWSREELVNVNLEAILAFSVNPFFRLHKERLLPLIINATNAWIDSENPRHDQRMRDVLKTQYQEVVWQVAFLCGGYENLRRVTQTHRECPP
jgi:hypothetical protein